MTARLTTAVLSLLADTDRFSGLRDRFSGSRARMDTADTVIALLVVLGTIATLVVFAKLSVRWGRRSFNSPRKIFRQLCRAHGLDRQTIALLKRVARWQRLKQPARLFLEPERFEPANLSHELQAHAAELLELRSRLFTFEVIESARPAGSGAADPAANRTAASAAGSATQAGRTEAVGAAAFAATLLEQSSAE